MTTVTIHKEKIEKQGGVVILSLKEYQKLCERAVPTYYLKGKKAEELDRLVEEGLKEYERGETIEASSLKEALKVYERRQRRQG
ncbi:MAG: hypothetical protein HY097_04400 [Nitrospinae bacterium]|nr:hypothetical protein [Nitrospinota bacterium]MBI3815781.1 hypothetical protein [Nitrospinota bacterium]